MKRTLQDLRALVRQAESELEAAKTRTALNTAAKKLMRAKQELKKAGGAAATRPAPGETARAGAS